MVLVPAGPFIMGTEEGEVEASPPHQVDLPAFYIDRDEVTNARYAKFVAATSTAAPLNWGGPAPPAGIENLPVTEVTWFDAMRYAVWAGKRLPTEAEWEKAARGTDGRQHPWGNSDDETRRNKDSSKLVPAGGYPQGLSPYGAADMSGNAWEWTADWYDAYPPAASCEARAGAAKSIHFGRKYKVVRGGGGEYLYGIANTGNVTQRARLTPYGSHDFVGFRCAKSARPAEEPYKPNKLLKEVLSLLNVSPGEQTSLSYEAEFAGYLREGKFPLNVVGREGQAGYVRTGVPFPEGLLNNIERICVVGPEGMRHAAQVKALSQWKDGSARWVLVDFPARAGERYYLDFRGRGASAGSDFGELSRAAASVAPLSVTEDGNNITIDTGAIFAEITRDELIKQVRHKDGASIFGPMQFRLETETDGRAATLAAQPAEKIKVEEKGPLHIAVVLSGKFAAGSEVSGFCYDLRVHAFAGSQKLEMVITITHKAKREVSVTIKDASVNFLLHQSPDEVVIGKDREVETIVDCNSIAASQFDDLHYEITGDGKKIAQGTRLPGWLASRNGKSWVILGVRHFWQNHPKALFATPKSIGVHLWTTGSGVSGFEWEGGLAKTHEIIVGFSENRPQSYELSPLRAVMPPAWACGTQALGGPMLPRCRESLEKFAYWELMRQASMQQWVRAMPSGFRDYGDAYLGGPYKGKNAYSNLEYDVPYNFLMAFLRTGQVWYLEAAEAMARHQADIDTDNYSGRAWKHSPMHTTTEAEFGHAFVRGLLLYHLLTGDHRSLEAARHIGDYAAGQLQAGSGIGNERQIGWSLYALTGLYDVTREERYLRAAEALCDRLIAGQASTGRFKIRWDNRIAFFNGIAMNGMLSVYQHNGSEALAEAIMKVGRRTLGMYPEYACRTLNGFCWMAQRTKDPRYVDILEKTWESSMSYLMSRSPAAEETHAWQFTHFAAKYPAPASVFDRRRGEGLSLFEHKPKVLPDPAAWKGTRLEGGYIEAYVKGRKNAPVMIIMEGMTTGRANLFNTSGIRVQGFELTNDGRLFQAVIFLLPEQGRIFRLTLDASGANAWQVHYDGDTQVTFYDPTGRHLPNLFPRAFGFVREGASQVKISLEAIGEGFHTASLYNIDGDIAATVRHFVDRDDKGRYELPLAASTEGQAGKWSVEVSKARVIATEGFLPYWATTAEELFNPEEALSAK